jgi:hypothetical protein
MKLHKILLVHGIFSQDIKNKVKCGQLKLDGEIVTDSNIDLDIFYDEEDEKFNFMDLGDFVFYLIRSSKECRNQLFLLKDLNINLDEISNCGLSGKIIEEFKKVHVLKVSKRESIILIKNV